MNNLKDLAENLGKGKEAIVNEDGHVALNTQDKGKDAEGNKDKKDKPPHDGNNGHHEGHGHSGHGNGGHGGGGGIVPGRSFGGAPLFADPFDLWNLTYPEVYTRDFSEMKKEFPSFSHISARTGRLQGWIGKVRPFGQDEFTLKVLYPPGYPKCYPKVFAFHRKITKLLISVGHPHFYADGSICTVFPSDRTWVPGSDSIASFIKHSCIWLVGHLYWLQYGKWPLEEVSHNPKELLQLLKPDDDCHCGSGKPYMQCHYEQDLKLAS